MVMAATDEFSQDEFLDDKDQSAEPAQPEQTAVVEEPVKTKLFQFKLLSRNAMIGIGVSAGLAIISGLGLASQHYGWFEHIDPIVFFDGQSVDEGSGRLVEQQAIKAQVAQQVQTLLTQYPTKAQVEASINSANNQYLTMAAIEPLITRLAQLESSAAGINEQLRLLGERFDNLDINKLKAGILAQLSTSGNGSVDIAVVKQVFAEYEKESVRLAQLQQSNEQLQQSSSQSLAGLNTQLAGVMDRLLALEQAKTALAQPVLAAPVVEKPPHQYYLRGASSTLAFIVNKTNGEQYRVQAGFKLPGCGVVTAINPAAQRVTASECTITAKGAEVGHSNG
jgi:hypothetical protein